MFKYQPSKLILLVGIGTIALAACDKYLEVSQIEQTIQTQLSQQGGLSVKAVSCPKDVTPEDKTFDCVGVLNPDGGFFIAVKQGEQGTVSWDVPHSWRLLNLSKLETDIQAVLYPENPEIAKVDCDGVYRPVQPGDSFECKLTAQTEAEAIAANNLEAAQTDPGKSPSASSETILSDTIVIKVQPQGEITWHKVHEIAAKPAAVTTSATPAVPSTGGSVINASTQPVTTSATPAVSSTASTPKAVSPEAVDVDAQIGWTELAE